MNDKALLENRLPMSRLSISPQFQFDVNYRNTFSKISEDVIPTAVEQPFDKTIS
jgi:hypothetical protein